MLSDEAYLNGRLSALYGGNLPPGRRLQKVKLDPGRRAGVVTHPYLLSMLAYGGESSPIHRGVFLARGILGISLRPPQEAFTPPAGRPASGPDDAGARHPPDQRRGLCRVPQHHQPLGVLAGGGSTRSAGTARRRGDKPIDAKGGYETRAGPVAKFEGATQLAAFLADSEDVHGAFALQLFQHLVKQPVRAFGLRKPAELRRTFRRRRVLRPQADRRSGGDAARGRRRQSRRRSVRTSAGPRRISVQPIQSGLTTINRWRLERPAARIPSHALEQSTCPHPPRVHTETSASAPPPCRSR
jgi:hypothetical protein